MYTGKLFGKCGVIILWLALIVIHFVLLNGMRMNQFYDWLYMSFSTFLLQIFFIDTILFVCLSTLMVI